MDMTRIGPLSRLLAACALTSNAGREQVERRRAFEDDHLPSAERARASLVVHYSKVHDSVQRSRDLVVVESRCCWAIDESRADLHLVASGAPDRPRHSTWTAGGWARSRPPYVWTRGRIQILELNH
ncbi:hypothetical protein D3I60_08730 [Brevibacterium permense]|nr:hypothetical protein [Brevibacterium permense]